MTVLALMLGLLLPAVLLLLSYAADFPLVSHSLQVLQESALIGTIPVGQVQLLETKVDNTLANQVNATYVTTVFDQDGYPVSIKTINLKIPALQTVDISDNWTPQSSGNFTINAFIVSDNRLPSLLAEPQSGKLVVVGPS